MVFLKSIKPLASPLLQRTLLKHGGSFVVDAVRMGQTSAERGVWGGGVAAYCRSVTRCALGEQVLALGPFQG